MVSRTPWKFHLFLSHIVVERVAVDHVDLHSTPPHEKKAERVNDKGFKLGMGDTMSAAQMEGIGGQRTHISA